MTPFLGQGFWEAAGMVVAPGIMALVLSLVVRARVRLASMSGRWNKAMSAAMTVLSQRYPGEIAGSLTRLEIPSEPLTATAWVLIRGDIAARVREFSFDAAMPHWGYRRLGRERAAVCREYIGAPTPQNFSAFLRAKRIEHDDEHILPADLERLEDMQGTIWAALYAVGWPVLCARVGYVDVDLAAETHESVRELLPAQA